MKLLASITLLSIMACASTSAPPSIEVGPEWYSEMEGEVPDFLYGYGQSAGEVNPALADASAKAAARLDAASAIQTTIQSMFERYLSSTSNGDAFSQGLDSTQVIRDITDYALTGFSIDRREAKGDYLFVRGRLDIRTLKEALRGSEGVAEAIKHVEADAKEAFDRMDALLDNRRGTR